jgi:hypothetical protein
MHPKMGSRKKTIAQSFIEVNVIVAAKLRLFLKKNTSQALQKQKTY